MKYHFKVYKEGEGFWAQCIEIEGCLTQGDTFEELEMNMQEALNLYIDEPENSKDLATLPDDSIKTFKTIVEVPVDTQIAFAFMVRYYRIKHGLTQAQAANKMGLDTIFSYQRLESKKCNPSLKIISRIKKAFPDFSVDYTVGC